MKPEHEKARSLEGHSFKKYTKAEGMQTALYYVNWYHFKQKASGETCRITEICTSSLSRKKLHPQKSGFFSGFYITTLKIYFMQKCRLMYFLSILSYEIRPKIKLTSLNLRKRRGSQIFFCRKPSKWGEIHKKIRGFSRIFAGFCRIFIGNATFFVTRR